MLRGGAVAPQGDRGVADRDHVPASGGRSEGVADLFDERKNKHLGRADASQLAPGWGCFLGPFFSVFFRPWRCFGERFFSVFFQIWGAQVLEKSREKADITVFLPLSLRGGFVPAWLKSQTKIRGYSYGYPMA